MNKELNLAQRIRAMKTGDSFDVTTKAEREAALKIAKTLFDAGVIKFRLMTRETEAGAFKVVAA